MRRIKALILGLMLALGSSSAMADCNGQPGAGLFCGNPAASAAIPKWATGSAMLDQAFGSLQGMVLNRGASLWTSTASPSLGLTGTATGSLTIFGLTSGSSILTVPAIAGTGSRFQLPASNGINGQTLITDGSGNTSWSSTGAGTVTSVGLALPASVFTVSGSPVVNTGTLTGTFATQSANLVWAGPTTGAASAPTFRLLVGADLPNPSASTLGGVQSFAAVGSQWIRQISTAGVPTASQPAFTDISGTLAASQCPNPSASTIGCVQSLGAVTSKWINQISTAGVPSATQPNFTDLLGSTTLGQLPTISNSSVLGNNSGGSSVPSALSATNVLDFIATTQGDILYRNASIWTALAPGTNGQVLTSGGAAANPTWTTVTGTGTVTSIATNNGLTGGTITTTGTLGLATIATGNVLAYTGAGSGVPVATTPSAVLDIIGSTTGNILYRAAGGTGWQVLAPGTNGQVLTQGASTPSWSNAGTVSSIATTYPVSGGTITTSGTLTSVAPTTSGKFVATSSTACKFSPYYGDTIKINGTVFQIPSAGIAGCATTSVFVGGVASQNLVASTLYYVYAFSNSGTVTADFSTTAHSTSATAGNIGTEIKTGDDTRSLIGMVFVDGSNHFQDSNTQRNTASWFNRPVLRGKNNFGGNTTTTSAFPVELNTSIRIEFVIWSDQTFTWGSAGPSFTSSASGTAVLTGLAIDGASAISACVSEFFSTNAVNGNVGLTCAVTNQSEGHHFATVIGGSSNGNTVQWGDTGTNANLLFSQNITVN